MNATRNPPPHDAESVRIRRGRVDSVDIFEIKENELDVLERGSPADLFLNYAIFLLSIAFSALFALFSATFSSEIVKLIAIAVMMVGFLVGPFLLILWWRNRQPVHAVVQRIRSRIRLEPSAPTEKVQDAPPETEAGQAAADDVDVEPKQ